MIGKSNVLKRMIALGSMITLSSSVASWSYSEVADVQKNLNGQANDSKNQSVDAVHTQNEKTNIIYISLDDIGFSDLGAYGSEIKTPNIDQLAADGLRYNNFHACPFSSATRASLLSGREHNSVGMGHVANVSLESDRPNVQGLVKDEAGLVSEILGENGYSAYGIGKWHIAPVNTVTPAGPFNYWPLEKGFDRYYGFMDGETDQYAPQLVNGNAFVEGSESEDYNLNDDLAQKAMTYITDHVSIYPEKPFFMNYAFGTGHSPQQVPQAYIDKYAGVYDRGWDAIRQARFDKQKLLGIIPKEATLAEFDSDVRPWNTLSKDEQKLYTRFMETYAGFVTQADEEVGKLMDHLKDIGEYDNTLIVLIGDNGASPDGGSDGTDSFIGSMSGFYQTSVERLMPKYNQIGTESFQALYPKGWAQVSNTPFKGYKGSVELGALRNPLIVTWPNGIEDAGGIREQYIHVADITPTVMEAVQAVAPEEIDGVKQMDFYGRSFVTTFDENQSEEIRDKAFYYISGDRALYADGWRAEGRFNKETSELTWNLYHPESDYTESENMAEQYPQKLDALKALFMEEAEKMNVLPLKLVGIREMSYVKKGTAADRKTFKYYDGMSGIISLKAAPAVETMSYEITVPLTYEMGDKGVLTAMGDNMGGHTLYVQDEHVVFEYNLYGQYFTIKSDQTLQPGAHEITFDFDRTSMVTGHGTLKIDGTVVGQKDIQTAILVTLEGLSIGQDAYHSVSSAYAEEGPFPYSGTFDYVQYDMTPFIPAQAGH